jgi:hypothetical protein
MNAAPDRAAAASRPRWEMADVFRLYGDAYRHCRKLPAAHLKVMHAIQVCRTVKLGGHLERCDSCGHEQPCYNSCRNRHCPKCGSSATDRWLQRHKQELLPTSYFHLVFTVPHELNVLFLTNPKILISILFRVVSETLSEFGRSHLHGRIGFLAVLHTWDQTLRDHFHIHCLIPGGALSFDGQRWIAARSNFLFHVRALSIVFRAKFLQRLVVAYNKDQLRFPGNTVGVPEAAVFRQRLAASRKKNWVVYAKRPFCSPDTVLDYLGRYTHRVAISNHRLLSVTDGRVAFLYRDRQDSSRQKSMTLDAAEFIRRFLLHVLPSGLMRVRHFGFMSNRWKAAQLERCREILRANPAALSARSAALSDWIAEQKRCLRCGTGTLIPCRTLPPTPWDSS